jgi:hypothetical protein
MLGGELVSGIPLLGCLTLRGDWVVGGIITDLLRECEALGGYIGPVSDFRSLNVVAFDPEIMKLAVMRILKRSNVQTLLYSFAEEVVVNDGKVCGLYVRNKSGRTFMSASAFVDCSGDADLAVSAGAPFESGDPETGALQALTLVFRMVGVDTRRLLNFIRDNPASFGLQDQPVLGMTRAQCAQALVEQGQPKAALFATSAVLKAAITAGDMFPVSAVAIAPVSVARREVSINATRIASIDATNTARLSAVIPELIEQVQRCSSFLKKSLPGFEAAEFSGIAPRVGIRETRRVVGEYVLTGEDVLSGRRHRDCIAHGVHEIDIHGAGTAHVRRPIGGGGTYDLPLQCLIPLNLKNVLVAGRCLSGTREGQSSARVMGTCMAMGQAAGTAAALLSLEDAAMDDVRAIPVDRIQHTLRAHGAILD